jgi:hypothetical protein
MPSLSAVLPMAELEKITNLLSKTIKDINDIQDELNRINYLEVDAVNKNSTHISVRMKGFKSYVRFHVYHRGKA